VKVLRIAEEAVYSRSAINRKHGNNKGPAMDYCHQHNLVDQSTANQERHYGIRVSLPAGDTLRNVLGDDWDLHHWYPSASERDTEFEKMAVRHGYYRDTDSPTQILEKVTR
jgi:hypothetical protein